MLLVCDLERFASPEEAFAFFKKELSLPDYFGENLDALYDCLTAFPQGCELLLMGKGSPLYPRFYPVLRDAAKENPNLTLRETGL